MVKSGSVFTKTKRDDEYYLLANASLLLRIKKNKILNEKYAFLLYFLFINKRLRTIG